jgi:hypothetical protein
MAVTNPIVKGALVYDLVLAPSAPVRFRCPQGRPGQLTLNGKIYTLEYIGNWREGILGYRLSPVGGGTTYDIPRNLATCECPDHHYRERICKHLTVLAKLRKLSLIS